MVLSELGKFYQVVVSIVALIGLCFCPRDNITAWGGSQARAGSRTIPGHRQCKASGQLVKGDAQGEHVALVQLSLIVNQ